MKSTEIKAPGFFFQCKSYHEDIEYSHVLYFNDNGEMIKHI